MPSMPVFFLLFYCSDTVWTLSGQLMYLWRPVLLESSNVSASTSDRFLLNPDTQPPTDRQTALVLQFWIHYEPSDR